MTRQRLTVLLAVVVGLVVAVAAVLVVVVLDPFGEDESRTDLETAFARAPADARRVLFTDWSGIRAELGIDLDAGSSGTDVEELLDRGYDADLTSPSALLSSAATMQEAFGFSPATLEWELFTQAESGASLVMRLGGGVDVDDVADRLRDLGYTEPDGPDDAWSSDSTVVPVTAEVTPELAFVALDADAGLVYASDSAAGVAKVREPRTDDPPVPDAVVAAAGDPLAAVLYSGTEACGALAMAQADATDQQAAAELVAQAGEVNPLTGFAMTAEAGGGVRVLMSFDDAGRARTNADTRAALAAGPAPGQGGDFPERFAVDDVTATGEVVRMDLTPVDDEAVLSDLTTGPVLFATC